MKNQMISNGLNRCQTKEFIIPFLYFATEKYFKNLISNRLSNFIRKFKSKLKTFTSFKNKFFQNKLILPKFYYF